MQSGVQIEKINKLISKTGFFGKTLDENERKTASGDFVTLSRGNVHYELSGPPGGKLLVFVHGLSVPGYIWDPVFNAMATSGYRVLRFDLYGRGMSDRPFARYEPRLYRHQLSELLSALNLTMPFNLIGVSMGGAVCADYALHHLNRIQKLCLINPAGLMPEPGFWGQLKQMPGIGEIYMALFGRSDILAHLYDDFYTGYRPKPYKMKMLKQMRYAGYKRSILSSIRSNILSGMEKTYRALGQHTNFKIMLIWGREDRIIPFENCIRLRKIIPDMVYCPMEKSGHLPHYEHPDHVIPKLKNFMNI